MRANPIQNKSMPTKAQRQKINRIIQDIGLKELNISREDMPTISTDDSIEAMREATKNMLDFLGDFQKRVEQHRGSKTKDVIDSGRMFPKLNQHVPIVSLP